MTEEEYDKLKYVIGHEPVLYVIERKWLVFWIVKNIDGTIIHQPSIFKFLQRSRCNFYNAVFSYGYNRGCGAILKSIIQPNGNIHI